MMEPSGAALPYVVNGEKVVIEGVSHLACPSCGEVVLRYADSKALQAQAIEAYRRSHRLLGAADIRDLRRQLGLTQQQLAALLKLGLNTVSRWESGRNVQNEAMDVLLRLLRDVPGNLEYLKKHAA
jgi:putative zinc finger/helix-turn-helix YgiT family protein